MMRTIKLNIVLVFVLGVLSNATAQSSLTLFNMVDQPMSEELNPAVHRDSSRFYIGFPLLSGFELSTNSDFAYSDLIHYGEGDKSDSLVIDFNTFHDALRDNNAILQEYSMKLIDFGFWAGSYHFSFHIGDKQIGQSTFDKRLVTFIRDGNANYLGQNYDLGDLGLNFMHYREYALGISKEINEKLTIGGKAKLLYGKSIANLDDLNMKVESGSSGEYLTLRARGTANISAPVDITFDEFGFVDDVDDDFEFEDYFLNSDNVGFGLDLGANYKITERWHVGASVVDLGSIKWKSDVYNLYEDGEFRYEGADLSQSVNKDDPLYKEAEDVFEDLTDSIKHGFRVDNANNSFRSSLPTKVYLSGNYFMSAKTSLGFVGRAYMYEGYSDYSATLSANTMLGKVLGVSASYSAMKRRYDNIGLGMNLRMGALQLYLVSDNIMSAINPGDARAVNLRFGMNMLFGRKYNRDKRTAKKENRREKTNGKKRKLVLFL